MILYHGSNTDIAEIDLSVSKVGKDFGCGFYLSADNINHLREYIFAQKQQPIILKISGQTIIFLFSLRCPPYNNFLF